jgi:hypothetical protein
MWFTGTTVRPHGVTVLASHTEEAIRGRNRASLRQASPMIDSVSLETAGRFFAASDRNLIFPLAESASLGSLGLGGASPASFFAQ